MTTSVYELDEKILRIVRDKVVGVHVMGGGGVKALSTHPRVIGQASIRILTYPDGRVDLRDAFIAKVREGRSKNDAVSIVDCRNFPKARDFVEVLRAFVGSRFAPSNLKAVFMVEAEGRREDTDLLRTTTIFRPQDPQVSVMVMLDDAATNFVTKQNFSFLKSEHSAPSYEICKAMSL